VDASGQTVEFLLSASRDTLSAKRFLEKALRSLHNGYPEALIVDRNPTYPAALPLLKREGHLGEEANLTTDRWLNNHVEQGHRRIKRLVRPGLGFKEFCSASRTFQGYEAMSMIRKGQVDGVGRGSWEAFLRLVEALFWADA
jgi:IS6 family transposase